MSNDDRVVLICQVADAPMTIAGSTFDRVCSMCSRRVMIAPSGQAQLRRDPRISIICNACIDGWTVEELEKHTVAPMTAEQIAELQKPMPNFWRKRN